MFKLKVVPAYCNVHLLNIVQTLSSTVRVCVRMSRVCAYVTCVCVCHVCVCAYVTCVCVCVYMPRMCVLVWRWHHGVQREPWHGSGGVDWCLDTFQPSAGGHHRYSARPHSHLILCARWNHHMHVSPCRKQPTLVWLIRLTLKPVTEFLIMHYY